MAADRAFPGSVPRASGHDALVGTDCPRRLSGGLRVVIRKMRGVAVGAVSLAAFVLAGSRRQWF
jgi:hypothetical protein